MIKKFSSLNTNDRFIYNGNAFKRLYKVSDPKVTNCINLTTRQQHILDGNVDVELIFDHKKNEIPGILGSYFTQPLINAIVDLFLRGEKEQLLAIDLLQDTCAFVLVGVLSQLSTCDKKFPTMYENEYQNAVQYIYDVINMREHFTVDY